MWLIFVKDRDFSAKVGGKSEKLSTAGALTEHGGRDIIATTWDNSFCRFRAAVRRPRPLTAVESPKFFIVDACLLPAFAPLRIRRTHKYVVFHRTTLFSL